MYEEPSLTQKDINKCKVVKELLKNQTCTKMQIANVLAEDNQLKASSKERQARAIISMVAKYYPVISLSGEKGYRIATKPEDLDDAVHQIKDLQSRIDELYARMKPLEKFCKKQKDSMGMTGVEFLMHYNLSVD